MNDTYKDLKTFDWSDLDGLKGEIYIGHDPISYDKGIEVIGFKTEDGTIYILNERETD